MSVSAPISSFVAFASQEVDVEALKEFAHSKGLPTSDIYQGTIVNAIEFLSNNASPDLLLVEIPERNEATPLLDRLAELCDPSTNVITIGKVNEYSFYCWLLEIGIAHYMLSPIDRQILDSAFEKITASSATKSDKPQCKTIAVMGTRGGVGTTTVAINLAGILAEGTRKKVALVDLDPQEGSVSLALDIQPSVGLRDVLQKPDRIDSLFLDRIMNKFGKYLSVLSAEEALSDQLIINENAATPLLAELTSKYDYVVLDVPRHMNMFSRICLQSADHTLLVTELSLLSLRDTLRMQDAMREGWKAKPPLIIANRVGLAPKQEVPVADYEKGANIKIYEHISFAPDLFMQISSAIPAVEHKNQKTMQPLYKIAAVIAPQIKNKADIKTQKKSPFSFNMFTKGK